MEPDRDQVNQTREAPPPSCKSGSENRCRRCEKVLESLERETYFARTGLCFWCAYVDSQG